MELRFCKGFEQFLQAIKSTKIKKIFLNLRYFKLLNLLLDKKYLFLNPS